MYLGNKSRFIYLYILKISSVVLELTVNTRMKNILNPISLLYTLRRQA